MNSDVLDKLNLYPEPIKELLLNLRTIIFELAQDNHLGFVRESLKWNEPSYHAKGGSPIRIDWKSKTPDDYYIFFNCNTSLVETFRKLFSNSLTFQGKRAIVLNVKEPLPVVIISQCILMALTYKRIKDLPLLGA